MSALDELRARTQRVSVKCVKAECPHAIHVRPEHVANLQSTYRCSAHRQESQ